MKTWQIKLNPLSSLFQGLPSSDTLFGAICWGIKRIYGETKLLEILKNLPKNPSFILSSSFPYLENSNNNLPLYPKPVSPGLFAPESKKISEDDKDKKEKVEVVTEYKKFKKIEYVSESIFKNLLDGIPEKELFNKYQNKLLVIRDKTLLTKEEEKVFLPDPKDNIYKIESVQKNTIDRLAMSTWEEGQTFYQQEYFPSSRFKLHFLMKTNDINFFKPIFRYLEDKGIGGNRSTGKGRFEIEVLGELSIGNRDINKFVTLSKYIPDIEEIKDSKVSPIYYEILPFRSKVDSEAEFKGEDIWKAKVMYLKEGSCFEATEKKEFYGSLPVAKEIAGQKIYQNGIAFPIFGNFGG